MLRKLSLVVIDGAVSSWDRLCREGLSKYPIHPKDALFAADSFAKLRKRALFPFEECFLYERQAAFLIKLCRDYAGIILRSGPENRYTDHTYRNKGTGPSPVTGSASSPGYFAGTVSDAAAAADSIRLELSGLFKERSKAKAELGPMIASYQDTERRLIREELPERKLYYGRLLNEEHGDIFRARQRVYDIDIRIGSFLSERAQEIRRAKDCLERELQYILLRHLAGSYMEGMNGALEQRFLLILIMSKRDAEELRQELEAELDISLYRCDEKRFSDYWQSSETICLNNYGL